MFNCTMVVNELLIDFIGYCPQSGEVGPTTCVGHEQCIAGICVCPSPFFGSNCDLIGIPIVNSIQPSNGTENGGTVISILGANITASDLCVFAGPQGSFVLSIQ